MSSGGESLTFNNIYRKKEGDTYIQSLLSLQNKEITE